jgi:aryl sulfotransferase
MSAVNPPQGAVYRGPVTDTSRWTNFKRRPGDIFVCTPAKCGTTWTQAICAMLVFGKADHGAQPGNISPWVDADFAPIEDYLKQIEAQTHRRYLKTHTPFDGIPYHADCVYLVVLRDPRDVYISSCNHRDNMNDQELALKAFPNGPNAFHDWLYETREPGTWDRFNLTNLVDFFKAYWPYRDLENVHLFHYSDMKRDLRKTISAMAAATNTSISDEQLDSFTKAASFDHMKSNASQFAPTSGVGFWKTETGFFANGRNAQWKDKLSADDLTAFDARIGELLPPDQVDWLLNGDG